MDRQAAHECTVRTRYGEVDRMGVVYHGNYLAYFEKGRTEYLRALGATYRELEDAGTLLIVTETGMRFHKPAGYDEELRIRTQIAAVRGVRIRFEYEVLREEDLLVSGHTVLACADRRGRPCRPPASLRGLLEGAPVELVGSGRKSAAPTDVQEGIE